MHTLIETKRVPLLALHVDFANDDAKMLKLLSLIVSSLKSLETLWLVCHSAAKMNVYESIFDALPRSLHTLRLNFSGGYGLSRAVTMTEADSTVTALAACADRLKLHHLSLFGFDIDDSFVEGVTEDSSAAPLFNAIGSHSDLRLLEIGSRRPYGQFSVTKASAFVAFFHMILRLKRLRTLRCSSFWMHDYVAKDENVPSFYDALIQSRSLLETDFNLALSKEQMEDLKKRFAENDLTLQAEQLCDLTISLVKFIVFLMFVFCLIYISCSVHCIFLL